MKMRYLIYLLCVIAFAQCSKSGSDSAYDSDERVTLLLDKFKDISFDVLEVYSSGDLSNGDFAFRGVKLDSNDIELLPHKLPGIADKTEEFFACFKFPIDSNRVGLIARTPSYYTSSSVKLFVFDKSRNAIIDSYVELAELTGDAGYSMETRSLLFREGSKISYIVWLHEREDMSIEDKNDTTIKTWDHLHLLAFNNAKFDTLDHNTEALKVRYKDLVNSLPAKNATP